MKDPGWSRRQFAGLTTLTAAAISHAGSPSPNSRLNIGLIGTGGRMRDHFNELRKIREAENLTITAVCDVYRPNREAAVERVEKEYGAKPRVTTRYQELLQWKDVDAVIIATPDFSHPIILEDAIRAGKDVFVEKPFATDLPSAKSAFRAAQASDRIVQVGSQRRSDPGFIACAKQIQSGILGKITRIDIDNHFQEARWRRDHHMIQAADVDWDAFRMGGRIHRQTFDARLFREWQLFEETTNGIPGLWMSHFIDLVAWYLNDPYPKGAVSNGGVYLWKDGRQTCDVFHTLVDYNDCLVSFAMSLTNASTPRNLWYGVRGTLDANALTITGAGSRDSQRIPVEIRVLPEPDIESHIHNWVRCVRSRKEPRAPVQAGFSHAVAGILASEALRKQRRITFDARSLEMSS
jgi:predicted dehydrogenase